MTVFGTIFEVKNSIGKLWDLLGHSNKKGTVDFDKCHFLFNNSIMYVDGTNFMKLNTV